MDIQNCEVNCGPLLEDAERGAKTSNPVKG